MDLARTPVSKALIVAICLGLALWMFGLSRLGYNQKLKRKVRIRANLTGILLLLSIMGFVFGIWSMPITHRLVFGIVFSWTAIPSIELICSKKNNKKDPKMYSSLKTIFMV